MEIMLQTEYRRGCLGSTEVGYKTKCPNTNSLLGFLEDIMSVRM